jgi:hypothetical protein
MSHSWSTLNPNHTQSTLPNRAWTKTSPTQKPHAKSSRWCPRGTLPTPKEIQYILVYLLCSKYGFFLTKSDSLRKPVNINKTQPLWHSLHNEHCLFLISSVSKRKHLSVESNPQTAPNSTFWTTFFSDFLLLILDSVAP